MVFAQYRELGVVLWRGYSVQAAMDQRLGNVSDVGKGRQSPVLYGSRDLNLVTMSPPLANQMPQAVGAAYTFKQKG